MCDPGTIAIVSTVAAMTSTGIGAIAQAQQASHQASVASYNASAQRLAAQDAMERGRMAQERLGREQAGAAGRARAAMAANGVDIDFGTAAGVQGDYAAIQAEDRFALGRNIDSEIRGFDIGATNFDNEASAARATRLPIMLGASLSIGSEGLAGVQQFNAIKADRAAGGRGWGVYSRRAR